MDFFKALTTNFKQLNDRRVAKVRRPPGRWALRPRWWVVRELPVFGVLVCRASLLSIFYRQGI